MLPMKAFVVLSGSQVTSITEYCAVLQPFACVSRHTTRWPNIYISYLPPTMVCFRNGSAHSCHTRNTPALLFKLCLVTYWHWSVIWLIIKILILILPVQPYQKSNYADCMMETRIMNIHFRTVMLMYWCQWLASITLKAEKRNYSLHMTQTAKVL